MSEIVNLNKFRKSKARLGKEDQAAENRVRFGRSKAEKSRAKQDHDRREQDLDGKDMSEPPEDG